jgi:hypothetical protein
VFLFYAVIGNTDSSSIVSLDRGWRLRMAKFREAGISGTSFFAIVKHADKFGFSGAGEDFTHDVTRNVDGSLLVVLDAWVGEVW